MAPSTRVPTEIDRAWDAFDVAGVVLDTHTWVFHGDYEPRDDCETCAELVTHHTATGVAFARLFMAAEGAWMVA